MLKTPAGRLRAIGIAEGISFLLLLGIAMPLKYLAGQPEAVRIVGTAHGFLFLAYLVAVVNVWIAHRWPFWKAFLAGAGSVVPFGPFLVDAYLLRERPGSDERPAA